MKYSKDDERYATLEETDKKVSLNQMHRRILEFGDEILHVVLVDGDGTDEKIQKVVAIQIEEEKGKYHENEAEDKVSDILQYRCRKGNNRVCASLQQTENFLLDVEVRKIELIARELFQESDNRILRIQSDDLAMFLEVTVHLSGKIHQLLGKLET